MNRLKAKKLLKHISEDILAGLESPDLDWHEHDNIPEACSYAIDDAWDFILEKFKTRLVHKRYPMSFVRSYSDNDGQYVVFYEDDFTVLAKKALARLYLQVNQFIIKKFRGKFLKDIADIKAKSVTEIIDSIYGALGDARIDISNTPSSINYLDTKTHQLFLNGIMVKLQDGYMTLYAELLIKNRNEPISPQQIAEYCEMPEEVNLPAVRKVKADFKKKMKAAHLDSYIESPSKGIVTLRYPEKILIDPENRANESLVA